MAGPNAGAAAVPCKMTNTNGDIFVNSGDLPVSVVVVSDPPTCNFKIAQVVIFDDTGGSQIDTQNVNSASAKLPPTKPGLAAGTYRVFVNISPADGAHAGGDPFNGGRAAISESCSQQTLLFLAGNPFAQFKLVVR
jgi:hypothetical protein